MLELTDTHCHINLPEFDDDRPQVLERARASGVRQLLIPGVDLETSTLAVELAKTTPGVYAAVGIHPHYASRWNDTSAGALRKLAVSSEVVAIGEIGLDFYRNLSPPDVQRFVFEAQLEIAAELGLPVIIHQRDSIDAILDTLDMYVERLPPEMRIRSGVLHAFSGDTQAASSALAKGFYLGVAGPLTFRKADDLRGVVSNLPTDRLLIETDSPYMAPAPHRGKRNEPMYVRHVAEQLAHLCGLDINRIAQVTSENADHLFRWCNETANRNLS